MIDFGYGSGPVLAARIYLSGSGVQLYETGLRFTRKWALVVGLHVPRLGLIVRHRYLDAWNATAVGDSVPTVINRFGAPDYMESPLRYSRPDFCAQPQEKCPDDYAIRLWYQLRFTFVVGGHVLVVDFDDRQRVINKSEMRSP